MLFFGVLHLQLLSEHFESPSTPSVFTMSSVSSSSSVESVSDRSDSRSTTPSSVASDASSYKRCEVSATAFPTTYVCVASTFVEPQVVKAIFDTYAQGGSLGLCIPSVAEAMGTPSFADWKKESIVANGETKAIDILVSPGKCVLFDQDNLDLWRPIVSTNPQVAYHLNVFSLASLRAVMSLPRLDGYVLHTLEQPSFVFTTLEQTPGFSLTSTTSKGNVPSLEEWQSVWSAWDLVTLQMIPHDMLLQKPIDLRHKCLFYIGHIPTQVFPARRWFLDMLLSKSIGGGASEPQYFWNIFERGIDPHVDDPEYCHSHSEVPEKDEDWPTLDTVIGFRNRVRARLAQLYDELKSGKRRLTRNIARTLVMTIEHEGFHIETLLYMLIQRAGTGTLPPPGFVTPPWKILTQQWDANPPPGTPTVTLGPATVTLGHDDSEGDDSLEAVADDVEGHVFGWDNESPARKHEVGAFRVDWRPVTNREFETFWRESGACHYQMPGSWVEEGGEIKVRTMYGPVPMEIGQHWPVLTSYDQLLAYAHSKGGRLPTEQELRLFLDTYDVGHEGGSNTGLRNWHPIPATMGLEENGGKGSNGGVWEWTSTLFDTHEGLSPTKLFTGYSTDFFDTKHQVVLGASYATIPRIASRRTVRNFYQHNYPYPWVGGRVVYDV
ncbi:Ergothioneine biosynthesis protein 1 [Hypsizygus marmoreus]|uniref:Ergothioneine biosynthesis protein 1 n=1 Tax=Hypsizygus marmoreus TaxID=39966 RepID=A0A369KAL7_HYPMA|nr:Ergothioneine biosynthesis protein 1 [Hypsizygus marmoreus]